MVNTIQISRPGMVKSVSDQTILVSIETEEACVSCHARGTCQPAGNKTKEIEISKGAADFTEGEMVLVLSTTRQGLKAVWIAYLLPLLVLLLSLAVLQMLMKNELIAASGALACLAVYYIGLSMNREKLSRSCSLSIRKISTSTQYE